MHLTARQANWRKEMEMNKRIGVTMASAIMFSIAWGAEPLVLNGGEKTIIESKGAGKITVEVEDAPAQTVNLRKVAVIVQPPAPGIAPVLPGNVANTFTAAISGRGFSVVVPENSIGMTQNRLKGSESIQLSSAIALGRNLGAEGVITVSLLHFSRNLVSDWGCNYSIRMSANLFDCASSHSVCGVNVKATSQNYNLDQERDNKDSLIDEIVTSVVEICADKLVAKPEVAKWQPRKVEPVTVFFGCNVLGADVQIDEFSYGTCPAKIAVAPGHHDIVVSYPPYYFPFKRRAMFTENGQQFAVVLQITPEGEKTRRSGELFDKQKALFDAQLKRYGDAGITEDYVRKTIAEGVAMYWKNSYGRIVITEGTAENIDFTTPHTDIADLQDAPNTSAQVNKMHTTLSQAGATTAGSAKDARETLSDMKAGIGEGAAPAKKPNAK